MFRIAAALLSVVCCLGFSALAADLGPGGVYFSGSLTDRGFYRMEVQLQQTAADQPQIIALKVYSEPSHTLMLALLDDSTPADLLESVQVESPLAMASATIQQSRLFVEAATPPLEDQRIRIEYATDAAGEAGFQVLADGLFESLDEVAFSVEPQGGDLDGGSNHICGWCWTGGNRQLCGCIDCSIVEFTVCCNVNPCTIYCGHVVCTH